MSKNRSGIYCRGFFIALFSRRLPRKARKNEKKLHGRYFARIFTIIKLFSKMEETSFLDTLTGKESIKVEHIVTTPISTIIYIVAGVALARVVSSFFDK